MANWLVAVLLMGMGTTASAWTDVLDPDYDWSYGVTIQRNIPSAQAAMYRAAGTEWLWVEGGGRGLSTLGQQLRGVLLSADIHGLDPSAYWTSSLEKQFQNPRRDPESFERAASAAVIRYATHVAVGRVNPRAVAGEIRVPRRSFNIALLGTALRDNWDLQSAIDSLAPRTPAYRQLQDALAHLKSLDPAVDFPETPTPKVGPTLGQKHELVARVKTRLRTLGYPLSETGPQYNQELLNTLRRYFQENAIPGEVNMRAESPLWPHVGVPLAARIQQVRMSMEKLRWMPTDPGPRYFEINLALQKLRIYENGRLVMEMRTINGRPDRKSPTLNDKLTMVELNPAWTVPSSIILKDKVKAILEDPNYFKTHNYEVFKNGRRVDPSEVDWAGLDQSNVDAITLRQLPGKGNALGVIKFHLTNPYAIYLHDTNEPWLFNEGGRLFSSGCIRLQQPLEVAMDLLRDDPTWRDRAKVESELATTPVAGPSVRRMLQIPLKRAVPVYTNYLTAEADDSGIFRFANDYYGQDVALFNMLKGQAKTVPPKVPIEGVFDRAQDGP